MSIQTNGPLADLRYEVHRLETFRLKNWPESVPIGSEKLAKAGFYYEGNGDEVKCFVCGVKVSNWSFEDRAISVHSKKCPNCPFLVHPKGTGNVPIVNYSQRRSASPSCRPVVSDVSSTLGKFPSETTSLTQGVVHLGSDKAQRTKCDIFVDKQSRHSSIPVNPFSDTLSSKKLNSMPSDQNEIIMDSEVESASTPVVKPASVAQSRSPSASSSASYRSAAGDMDMAPSFQLQMVMDHFRHDDTTEMETVTTNLLDSYPNRSENRHNQNFMGIIGDNSDGSVRSTLTEMVNDSVRGTLSLNQNVDIFDTPRESVIDSSHQPNNRNSRSRDMALSNQHSPTAAIVAVSQSDLVDQPALSSTGRNVAHNYPSVSTVSVTAGSAGRRNSPSSSISKLLRKSVQLDMKCEADRLSSFKDWRNSSMLATELARWGFYFTGKQDTVMCAFCRGRLRNWESGDNAAREHAAHFPECPFMLGASVGNQPIIPNFNPGQRALEQFGIEEVMNARSPISTNSTVNDATDTPMDYQEYGESGTLQGLLSSLESRTRRQNLFNPDNLGRTISTAQWVHTQSSANNNNAVEARRLIDALEARRISNDSPSFSGSPQNQHYGSAPSHSVTSPSAPNVGSRRQSRDGHVGGLNLVAGSIQQRSAGSSSSHGSHASRDKDRADGQGSVNNFQKQFEALGVFVTPPKCASMVTYHERVRSFDGWPPAKRQRPQDLANAGFYYTGTSDSVKCFQCDGGLRNWLIGDDAWTEHARWFPRCEYVRSCKGDAFVRSVLAKYETHGESAEDAFDRTGDTPVCEIVPVLGDAAPEKQESKSLVARSLVELAENGMDINSDMIVNATSLGYPDVLIASAYSENLFQEFDDLSSLIDRMEALREEKPDIEEEPGRREEHVISPDVQPTSIESENRKLKEQKMCKICMDADVSIVFLPCGHLVSCPTCAPAMTLCPICRVHVKGTVRAFMS